MDHLIGIRREDKSRWEARAPLTPEDVRHLTAEHGVRFQVQASPHRVFRAEEYRAAGAAVVEELRDCPIILGVKEIPVRCFEPGKTYVFFSHTIKGQPANMPMLRRIIELGCTLIDYERIVDGQGRRLVFFGRFAGLAGMIDTLWALGRRLEYEGIGTPLAQVRRAYEYENADHARREIARVGEQIRRDGLPDAIQPLVFGFAGYGHVSQGAQEILDLLPVHQVDPDELADLPRSGADCCKTVFQEKHTVERVDGGAFDLQDYCDRPDRYRSRFIRYLPHLTVLVNGIYWTPAHPRLVTCAQLRELFAGRERPRLRVIGDISCDINGSIECTVRTTEPDDPVYVYDPQTGQVIPGVAGEGPVILAVDFLPCELPADASRHFGQALRPFIPALARADLGGALAASGLPPELQRATIVYRGELTGPYRYLEAALR